ncbi:hypothetical protein J6590_055082 [Homalodisca vitripennis]|nr:hypothetical protein J6590_055082 [Homalodisca vitripennis]
MQIGVLILSVVVVLLSIPLISYCTEYSLNLFDKIFAQASDFKHRHNKAKRGQASHCKNKQKTVPDLKLGTWVPLGPMKKAFVDFEIYKHTNVYIELPRIPSPNPTNHLLPPNLLTSEEMALKENKGFHVWK